MGILSSNYKSKDPIINNIITTGVLLCFLISFTNIYSLIPLYWGNQGLLPITELLNTNQSLFPSIAPLLFKLKLVSSAESFMSLCCLTGIIGSVIGILFGTQIIIALTWYCYLNLFLLGQELMSFEWDYLLLEVGFITIFFKGKTTITNRIQLILSCYAKRMLKFVSLKYLLGTGLGLVRSKSRLVFNLGWLNAILDKQYLPTQLSFYMSLYLPIEVKKLLAVIGLAICVFAPFGQFIFIRRIKVFIGQLIFLYHFCMLLIGNFGMVNVIGIIINCINFDDEYIHAITVNMFQEKKKETSLNTIGNDALNFLINRFQPKEEDTYCEGILTELFIFISFAFVFFASILLFIFPIKTILTSSVSISTSFFSQSTLNYWMIAIVIYCIISFLSEVWECTPIKKVPSTFIAFIPITLCVGIYLAHSINILYSGLGFALATKYKGNAFYSFIDLSYQALHHCHCVSSYSQFSDLISNDETRRDLVIKYQLNNETGTEWNEIEFYLRPKMNSTEANMRWMPLRQPRLSWLFSSLTINSETGLGDNDVWLVSLLGRLFEKNEDLFKTFNATIPQREITKIKIESYMSGFTSNSSIMLKKHRLRDYIKPIEKTDLDEAIKQYHLPMMLNLNQSQTNTDEINIGSSKSSNTFIESIVITIGLICLCFISYTIG